MDDKALVVICATVIVFCAMLSLENADAATITSNGLTGLFGVAVGKALK